MEYRSTTNAYATMIFAEGGNRNKQETDRPEVKFEVSGG